MFRLWQWNATQHQNIDKQPGDTHSTSESHFLPISIHLKTPRQLQPYTSQGQWNNSLFSPTLRLSVPPSLTHYVKNVQTAYYPTHAKLDSSSQAVLMRFHIIRLTTPSCCHSNIDITVAGWFCVTQLYHVIPLPSRPYSLLALNRSPTELVNCQVLFLGPLTATCPPSSVKYRRTSQSAANAHCLKEVQRKWQQNWLTYGVQIDPSSHCVTCC